MIASAEYPKTLSKRQADDATPPDDADPTSDDPSLDAPTQDQTQPQDGGEGSADGEPYAKSSGDGTGGVSELTDGDDDGPPVTGPFLPSVSAQPGTARQPLKDDISGTLDLLYYGPINIGTPAQVCVPNSLLTHRWWYLADRCYSGICLLDVDCGCRYGLRGSVGACELSGLRRT